MRYVPGNAQHIGSRQEQEDSFGFSDLEDSSLVRHGGFVAAVADGMGGLAHGRNASQAGIRAFLESYALKNEDEEIPHAMERAVRDANHAVVQVGKEMGAPGDVGSTLVAVALRGLSLYWISVGDSAFYLMRNGRLTLLNNAHTYANELDRKVAEGSMSREQAQEHPDREALTSYLGQQPLKEIDRNVKAFPLQAGDQVLLCTDGVFKTLAEEQMNGAMDKSPQRSCERVLQQALAMHKEHQDNLTVLSIGIEENRLSAGSVVTKATMAQALAPPHRRRAKSILGVLATAVAIAAIVLMAIRFRNFRHPVAAAQPIPHEGVSPAGGPKPTPAVSAGSTKSNRKSKPNKKSKPNMKPKPKPGAAKGTRPKQTSNPKVVQW